MSTDIALSRERDGLRQEVYDLQGNLEEMKIKDSMTRGELDRLTKEVFLLLAKGRVLRSCLVCSSPQHSSLKHCYVMIKNT